MRMTLKCCLAILIAAAFITGCQKDHDGVSPGSYVALSEINTFGGDTVLLSGQASNYAGLASVNIACPAWNIDQTFDLMFQKPVVFNYEYALIVPRNATFPQDVTVTVADLEGLTTTRTIPARFIADTKSPWFRTSFATQVGIDLDLDTGKGVWACNASVEDDRDLASITLSIPGIGYEETRELSGRVATFATEIVFSEMANLPFTLTVRDATGNTTSVSAELVIAPKEDEDPVSDFAQLYLFDAEEKAEEYLDGYYHYMARKDAFVYSCRFRAYHDNYKLFFSDQKSLDGNLIGVSPYVSSKLLNKKGYSVPVTIEKAGIYTITVNLSEHTFSVSPYDVPAAEAGPFYISGTGFKGHSDWSLYASMTAVEGMQDVYAYVGEIDGAAAGKQYYFFTGGWAVVYRGKADGTDWYIAPSGSCVSYKTDYDGLATFYLDAALPWGWIKK